ncbi:hypothetical protein AB205_0030370, partial [Aquarana catesbeiana]
MDLGESHPPKGIFVCHLCGLSVPYTYFGQNPPHTHSVMNVVSFTPNDFVCLVLQRTKVNFLLKYVKIWRRERPSQG